MLSSLRLSTSYTTPCYLTLGSFLSFDDGVDQYLLSLCLARRQRRRQARHDPCVEAAAAALAPGVPQGAVAHPARRLLFWSGVVCTLRGAETRRRNRHGEERLADDLGRALEGRGPVRLQACATHDPPKLRVHLADRELATRAPGDHQGGSDRPFRWQTEGQLALHDHKSVDPAAARPRRRLLRPGPRGEPAEGTQAWSTDRPHQLHKFPGQPVTGAGECCRLCTTNPLEQRSTRIRYHRP